MQTYLNMGRDILANGNRRGDRTGTGTVSVFGRQYRFDLAEGFPLLTSKKMFLRGIIEELLWFLKGDTNNNSLLEHNVHIWDEWAINHSVDFPMFSTEFVALLQKQYPEKVDEYLSYEKQHAESISGVTNAPMLKLWQVQVWAKGHGISAMKKKPILTLDDRIHWMIGMCDPVISEQINYEYCLNGVQKRDDNGVITKLDGLGVPPITPTDGDLGPIYGKQWRSWTGKVISADVHVDAGVVNVERQNHDQIAELIEGLKKKPFSRRHIVSAWNVEDLPDESISPQENVAQGRMALAPCHCLFQFYVSALNQNEIAAMIDARGLTEEFTMASIDALDRDMKGEKGAAVDYLPAFLDKHGIPKYKLSCQLYQR